MTTTRETILNDQPRQKLFEILNKRGEALLHNPKLLEDLLRDHCAEYRPETVALMNAHREGIPAALLTELGQTSEAILVGRLRMQLQTHQSMEAEAARWAVEAWLQAVRPFTVQVPVEEVKEQPQKKKEPPQPAAAKLTPDELRELALAKLRVDPKGEFLLNLLIEKGADATSAALAIDAARKQLAGAQPAKDKNDWWQGILALLGIIIVTGLALRYLAPPVVLFFFDKWSEAVYAFHSGDYAGALMHFSFAAAAGGGLWIVSRIIKKLFN